MTPRPSGASHSSGLGPNCPLSADGAGAASAQQADPLAAIANEIHEVDAAYFAKRAEIRTRCPHLWWPVHSGAGRPPYFRNCETCGVTEPCDGAEYTSLRAARGIGGGR